MVGSSLHLPSPPFLSFPLLSFLLKHTQSGYENFLYQSLLNKPVMAKVTKHSKKEKNDTDSNEVCYIADTTPTSTIQELNLMQS